MDRPIVELEVEVTSKPLDANMEANPGELFGNYTGARDIETAEVFIYNNNYMVEGGEESKIGPQLLCPICDSVVFTEGSLDAHMTTEHPVCRVCNVQFLRPKDLADHWSLHPQCGVCGESLLDWAELEEHQRGHTGVISDTLNITANVDLGETVSVDLSLGGNEQLMDGRKYSALFQEVNPDLCIENVECGGQNDVNSNPSFGSRYLCNFCSMVFTSLDGLHEHNSEDHQDLLGAMEDPSQGDQSPVNESSGFENTGGTNSPLLCGICKAGFEDFKVLSGHVSQHVSLGRLESGLPFLCKFCPPETCQFVEIDDLMRHTKVYHYKEEDHSANCPQCSRTFKNHRLLKTHISTHSTIKPFQCGGCFGTYSAVANLKIHFKNYCGSNKTPHVRPQLAKFQRPPPIDSNANPQEPDGVDGEKKVDTSASEKARRFTCQECGIVFRSRDLIQLHVTKCPAVKSKMLLHEAQVHLQGVEEKSCINLPNDPHKDFQQVSQEEDTAADVMSVEEDDYKMPPTSSYTITQVLSGKRGRPKKVALEICPDCGKSFKRRSSLYFHKCTPKIRPKENDDPNDDDDDEDYGPTTRGRSTRSRFSKKSPPILDRKLFKEEDRLDDNDWDCQDQVQTPISRAGSETTRSGRLIKRKRFFEPEPEIRKRLRRSTLSKGRSAEQEGSRCGPVKVSTACQICAEDLGSHMELFRHAVTHLEPGVDKTLPIYEDGETGWCPHCCEPVVVEFSEEHVLDKHPELATPGAGPSRVILPELKDELSPHLSDEETRSVIKDPC